MDDTPRPTRFDAATYGRSFADVYDRWYPVDANTDATVQRVGSLAAAAAAERSGQQRDAGRPTRILELGVGTGRLALPLAALGHQVTGMDSSADMLELLAAKGDGVRTVLGDVADPDAWPQGPFDVVVAAFNLLFNLAEEGAQQRLFDASAVALGDEGFLVIEAFLPAPLEMTERRLEVREVTLGGVVMIATDASPDTGLVTGQHIELRDGEPVRLRPWRIRVSVPDEIDRRAAQAGLQLVERHADWAARPFDLHGTAHVSVYRRTPA